MIIHLWLTPEQVIEHGLEHDVRHVRLDMHGPIVCFFRLPDVSLQSLTADQRKVLSTVLCHWWTRPADGKQDDFTDWPYFGEKSSGCILDMLAERPFTLAMMTAVEWQSLLGAILFKLHVYRSRPKPLSLWRRLLFWRTATGVVAQATKQEEDKP